MVTSVVIKEARMEISTIDTTPGSLATYSGVTDRLNTGPEIEWDPEHLVLSAWLEHVPFAFWLMKVLRPGCFVELGTERGVSYAAFCQAVDRLDTGSRCYAVDTWRGDEHAGHYDELVFFQVAELNERRYRQFSSLLRTTFVRALPYFTDGEIDLLHIDGLHTYEAVAEDFKTWRPKLSDRAVVLFHDTNERRDDFGVWRLWQELKAEFPHFEFVHGHGLGVIGVGKNLPAPLRALFDASLSDDQQVAVRGLFAARGRAVQRAYDLKDARQQAATLSVELVSLRRETTALQEQAASLHQQVEAAQAASRSSQAMADESLAKVASSDAAAIASQAAAESQRQQSDILRRELAEKDDVLGSLQVELDAATAEIKELSQRLIKEVADARREQAKRQDQVPDAAAEETIASLKARLVTAEARFVAAEARCNALLVSTSWRVTAPLRAVKMAMEQRQEVRTRPSSRLGRWSGRLRTSPTDVLRSKSSTTQHAAVLRDRVHPPKTQVKLLRLRVLIVAELSLPQCKKYRVDQKHDMIEALGWDCTVVGWPDTN